MYKDCWKQVNYLYIIVGTIMTLITIIYDILFYNISRMMSDIIDNVVKLLISYILTRIIVWIIQKIMDNRGE